MPEVPPGASPPGYALMPRGLSSSPILAATPTAALLLKALRRRWLLAATLGLIVAGITAAGVWIFLPPGMQTAYVKLYMPLHPDGILNAHPEDKGDFASFQRTQIALLKSRFVLNAALGKPKVRALNLAAVAKTITPVEWLDKEIKIETPDGPELPRVTMSGDDPEQLKILVTAVVDSYMEKVVQEQTAHRQKHIEQLKEISVKYEARLKQIQNVRSELAKAIGSGETKVIALKQELTQKQLASAQSELIKVDHDLRQMELEAKIYQSTNGGAVEVPDKLIEGYVDKDLEKETAHRAELEARLAKAKDVVDDDNFPKIKQLRAELDQKNKFLDEQRKKLRISYKAQLVERAGLDSKSQLAVLNQKIGFNREFKKLLGEEIEQMETDARKINDRAINLEGGRIDIQQAEASFARVIAEIDKATVELPAPARVSQLEEAIVVPPDEASRKLKVASLGAGGAFAVVLLLIGFLEFRSRRVDSVDGVVQGLGLEIMGTLPAAPSRFGGRLIRSNGTSAAIWQSMLAESVDSARTLLLRVAGAGTLRTVMITSATSGEGKTSLATHLAASLARAGHRTLLIDGDLRKPSAHRIFDLPLTPGLSEVLRGTADLAEAVRPTHANGLWLLPAGTNEGEVLQLLARDPGQRLLERLKQEYDFIVLDSAPLLGVADSLLLAQHVDGVLLSLFHGVSRMPQVYLACQRLSLLRVRVLGAVLNGTDDGVYSYGPAYATA